MVPGEPLLQSFVMAPFPAATAQFGVMRAARTIGFRCLLAGASVVLIGAGLLWMLPSRKHGPPAVGLRSFVRHGSPPAMDWDWTKLELIDTQPRRAAFEVYNATTRPLCVALDRAIADVEIVEEDGKIDNPNLRLQEMLNLTRLQLKSDLVGRAVYMRPGETNQLVTVVVPAGAKACRLRIIYWAPTSKDRFGVWCARSKLARRHPGLFNRVSNFLPDSRHHGEVIYEVPLPIAPR